MPNFEIKVTIPPESISYLRKLYNMPRGVPSAIQRGLDRGLETIKERLIEKRLSGSGPFPPSQHRLGQVSGTLRGSVYARSSIGGGKVTGVIGTSKDAFYAVIHEYGAIIKADQAPFLVFKVLGKTYRKKSVKIPERAPFRTEIESAATTQLISKEIVDEIEELASE
jgi:hypothetical protein